jgi:hypothetical protein
MPDFWPKWVFILYNKYFNGLIAIFGRFNPFLEDLGPFLRPDLGRKLGDGYELQAYDSWSHGRTFKAKKC